MSKRRLEALCRAASVGIDELEVSANDRGLETTDEMEAAQEGLWYLHQWLKEMNEVAS
jgi:hypothetical protein